MTCSGVVEEHEPRRAAGGDFDVDFDGVGVAADGRGEGRGVGERVALGLEHERAVAGGDARGIELMPEGPLQAEFGRFEVVRRVERRLLVRAGDGHGKRRGGLCAGGNAEPAVGGPLDGQQEKLAAECAVAVLVGVDGHVPAAIGCVDEAAVAYIEPAIVARGGADDGIVGRPLPGALGVAAACGDDGVAGGGAGGSAFRDDEVEPALALEELGGFEAGALHARGGGDRPGIEDFARRRFDGEAVGVELGHEAASHVEKAAAVFRDVAGIDGADAEVDGLAPGAGGLVGVDDVELLVGGEVDVEAVLVLAKVGRPHAAVVTGEAQRQRGAS